MSARVEAPVQRPSRTRLPGLEGYRGLAAVLVIVFHVYQSVTNNVLEQLGSPVLEKLVPWFDTMVELFFALSAFLLAMPYLQRAIAGRSAGSSREFLRRRAIRIVPLYLIVIVFVWAFRNPTLPGDLVDLAEHLTFTQVFDNKRIFYTDGPAWSLAVEVHFYILLALLGPLLCRGTARLRTERARVAATTLVLVLVALASLGYKLVASYAWHRPADDWRVWFTLPAKLDVMAFGMLAALVVVARQSRVGREPAPESVRELRLTGTAPTRGEAVAPAADRSESAPRSTPLIAFPASVAVALALVGCAALVVAILQYKVNGNEHVVRHAWAGAGFAILILLTVTQQPRWLLGFLDWRPMAFLGLVSYGVYLWQEPLLLLLTGWGLIPRSGGAVAVLVGSAVLVAASVLVAWVTYWVIEWPASMLRRTREADGSPRNYYA